MNVFESYRDGMYVVERPAERDWFQKRLRELDSDLFVQQEIGLDGVPVWVVYSDAWPPIALVEWRDDHGRPIPYLTENLLYRVAQMPRDAKALLEMVKEKNSALQARKKQEHNEHMGEIFKEMLPSVWGRGRILAPRGQKLYQQRNRRRARGDL